MNSTFTIKSETINFIADTITTANKPNKPEVTSSQLRHLIKSSYSVAYDAMCIQTYAEERGSIKDPAIILNIMDLFEFVHDEVTSVDESEDDIHFTVTKDDVQTVAKIASSKKHVFSLLEDLEFYVEELLSSNFQIFSEYKEDNKLTDTFAIGLLIDSLSEQITGLKYDFFNDDRQLFDNKTNQAIWLASCPKDGIMIPKECLEITYKTLKSLYPKISEISLEEFTIYATKSPEILRACFMVLTGIYPFETSLMSISKHEFDLILKSEHDLDSLICDDFILEDIAVTSKGAITFNLDNETLIAARALLQNIAPNSELNTNKKSLIDFMKLNFDFFLEFHIHNKKNIKRGFFERKLNI